MRIRFRWRSCSFFYLFFFVFLSFRIPFSGRQQFENIKKVFAWHVIDLLKCLTGPHRVRSRFFFFCRSNPKLYREGNSMGWSFVGLLIYLSETRLVMPSTSLRHARKLHLPVCDI